MARIKIMPEWLRNQIAAGEVVERPASVVKELVENAMDAGAARIIIEIEQGGKQRIRVVDNGCGMSREGALLSLERHATSKCESIEELRRIRTFGFRGEALPSIASVSRFTLRTRTTDEPVGTQVVRRDGRQTEVTDAAMAPGTEVTVEELFFNVPVRRKFMKKDATETRAVVDTVQRMALSNHAVHFELFSDGRKVLSAPPEADRLARIFAILGKRVCAHLYECYLEGRISVSGFISQPDMKRRGTSGLYTFVNGRFVRDKLLIQAVLNGYSTLLGRGEYPYAVLDLTVPPNEVDVNVHPTKSEVRFEKSGEVFAAVARAIRLTLSEAPWVTGELVDGSPPPGRSDSPLLPDDDFSFSAGPGRSGGQPSTGRPLHRPPAAAKGMADFAGYEFPPASAEGHPAPLVGETSGRFTNMTFLGQFANCYLLGQVGGRLVIVDQHAAHERVMFEKLKLDFEARRIPSQLLLVPILLELEPSLVAEVESKRELLERLGFALEPFGGNEVAVKSVPVLLRQRSPEPAIRAVLEELAENTELDTASLFHKPISTMACHMAVRAGDPMERDEALELFRQMDRVDLAAYCPHGRPVVVFFEESEVGRWFKRT